VGIHTFSRAKGIQSMDIKVLIQRAPNEEGRIEKFKNSSFPYKWFS
jgi:hypothetical protein